MISPITPGTWSTGPLRPSSANWPFDWTADVTAQDSITRQYQCVARITQAGSRPRNEAWANLVAIREIPELLRILRAVAHVIDMTDPEHNAFADSAADCLDALLAHDGDIRRVLSLLENPPGSKR